jgi:hypothetical protein
MFGGHHLAHPFPFLLNAEPLAPAHGFLLRAVTPGW